ncbi:bifunctional alpha,alpha-trehalose-phosphate synthase (UDP-forming)/trehalose-phosphatase [Mucilaginibacter auburnensis]|nr:bifunctional alpha,alpha-trehalose-phosphate synthase (UDP-forming)/trehalose-phosphatase [Mucilaginibacter auburnensis]
MKNRLIIISNRLPLTIEQNGDEYKLKPSSGGLVSAISSYLQKQGKGSVSEDIWVGYPGCDERLWNNAERPEGSNTDHNFLPVFIDDDTYQHYYDGFSNSLIWPLFHYFPSFAQYDDADFEAYMSANKIFADTLAQHIRHDDMVWIHDYHLMPLAGMLRKRFPWLTIGFFLHIPFPSYELFRVIPKKWQHEILKGIAGANLIGFHTIDYASHFLTSIERVLKVQRDGQHFVWDDRRIKVDAFPISIDFDKFYQAADSPDVAAFRETYTTLKDGKQLIFSVDRLDYTKGLENRLKGYHQFLSDNPDYIGKVVFILVIVPSRDAIDKYAEQKKMIDEYIGNLNSSMGSITWQPVIYHYNSLSFDELIALYTSCDLALITPLRDGMNLVAKEFVASRKDQRGVLILSEMAGAARELTDALQINPNDTAEIATMIKQALEMPEAEQAKRISAMQNCIKHYNVDTWASDFFDNLTATVSHQLNTQPALLDNFSKAHLLKKYGGAQKRLLLLDYDGTLVPFTKFPEDAVPDEALLSIIKELANNADNDVYIISGRSSSFLQQWLGNLNVGLIAEHGAKFWYRSGKWDYAVKEDIQELMSKVERIMDLYVAKCPDTFIEHKEFSLAWHYRNADPVLGGLRAHELFDQLVDLTASLPLNILNGNKVIEVRIKGINKGVAAQKVIDADSYDFILCIGDDKTDEDMFKKLQGLPNAYTVKVGDEISFAKYHLHSPYLVQSLLHNISVYPEPEKQSR